MISDVLWGVALLLVALVAWPTAANAYCITGSNTKWASPSTTRTLHFSPEYPSTWWSILDASVMRWDSSNVSGSSFNYGGAVAVSDWSTCNYRSFRLSFLLNHWPDVPAKSNNANVTPTHTTVDLDYNSYENGWYFNRDGTMSRSSKNVDLQTITVHEVGHASGMSHPDDPYDAYGNRSGCGRVSSYEVPGVTYANWTTKPNLAQDDKEGMAVMY